VYGSSGTWQTHWNHFNLVFFWDEEVDGEARQNKRNWKPLSTFKNKSEILLTAWPTGMIHASSIYIPYTRGYMLLQLFKSTEQQAETCDHRNQRNYARKISWKCHKLYIDTQPAQTHQIHLHTHTLVRRYRQTRTVANYFRIEFSSSMPCICFFWAYCKAAFVKIKHLNTSNMK